MLSREEVGQRLESPRGKATRQWEREALQTAQALYAERDELAAEGLVLREALEAVAGDMDKAWLWPSTKEAVITALQLDTTLIAAEVERVKALEVVAEAGEKAHHALAMGENITPAFERLGHALAAWREGEG